MNMLIYIFQLNLHPLGMRFSQSQVSQNAYLLNNGQVKLQVTSRHVVIAKGVTKGSAFAPDLREELFYWSGERLELLTSRVSVGL